MELHPHGRPGNPDLLSSPRFESLLEAVLEVALPVVGQETHAWRQLLEDLQTVGPESAVRLAVRALAGDDFQLAEQVQSDLVGLAPRDPERVMRLFGEGLLDPALGWRLAAHRLRGLVNALPPEVGMRWLQGHGRPAAVALARHLPPPFIGPSGEPTVPALTAYVLDRFAEDERVFDEFCAGMHSGQTYVGDIAAQHEREAEVARRFLDHDLPRVRDWAHREIAQATQQASWWRARDEELAAP
jgi:hypothetical protein